MSRSLKVSCEKFTDQDAYLLSKSIRNDGTGSPDEIAKALIHLRDNAFCMTISNRKTGEVIAIVGYIEGHPGTGTVYIAGTDSINDYPVEFTRLLKTYQDLIMRKGHLHRLSSEVRSDKSSWVRWAKLCGWQIEGLMKHYYSDASDAILMAYYG